MNFRFTLPAALCALSALAALPAPARPPVPVAHPAPAKRIQFDPKKFIRVSELKPGMKGYALTVFKGTKIERFGIEILGVVNKFNEGKDYILFRATSGPPVTRGLNIAHGMSGSPIYINGRLAGAISMGLPFAKDPIGLATPIEDMLDAWSPDLPSKASPIGAAVDSNSQAMATVPSALTAGGQFKPLDVPVAASGLSQKGAARFASALAPFNLTVLATGGAGAGNNPLAQGATLVPGAAVGVSLVQGDIDLTATGTVTYRDGSRVLIFGHPFTGFGPIDAALTTAYIVDIFPSYQDSTKLGSPIKTVGRVFQDRPFSVGGVIGSQPQMVPVTVAVDDQSIRKKQTFHMRVINHPLLTGTLMTQLVDAAIEQVHGQPGDSVATVTMDADIEEIGHVRRTNTFYDAVAIDQAAVADLDDLMQTLSSNSFYPLAVRSLKVNVSIQNRHDTAQIDHIFLRQGKFGPGDTVAVSVVLKPFKREPVVRTVNVKIPLGTSPGPLTLSVRGGGTGGGGGISLGGGLIVLAPSTSSSSPAGNVSQLVKQLIDKPRNNELVARLLLPTSAINIRGEKLSGLPPTLSAAMQGTRTSGLKQERDEVKVVQGTPYIVSGSQSLTITVQKQSAGGDVPSSADSDAPSSVPDSGPADDNSGDGTNSDSSGSDGSPDAPSNVMSLSQGATVPAVKEAPPVPSGTVQSTTSVTVLPSPASRALPPIPATTTPTVKTVGRLAQVWRQGTAADFAAGKLVNVAVTSAGDVRLSAALARVGETGESYLWALLPDGKGGLYAGTGDRGMVYRMDAAGKKTPFFDTKELEVTCLASDSAGNLYAGTAPHGVVFAIPANGKGRKLFTAKEKYVTALCVDDTRYALYVATGGGTGRVYRAPLSGVVSNTPLFTSPEAHILSLALDKDGNIYAGAAPDGILYKIGTDGTSRVLYDAPEPNVSAVAVDSTGTVYAGTGPRGKVYKINDGEPVRTVLTGTSPGIASLRMGTDDTLYACAGNTVYKIGADETVQSFVSTADEQFLALAPTSGGAVYAGASVGTVYQIGGTGDVNGLSGHYYSVVHDAGLPAKWGTLTWTAQTPPGTAVALQTRTGDTERPDVSWSAWSAPLQASTGQPIASPAGRYLQVQAAFSSDADATKRGDVPRLQSVAAYYLPRNQAPTIKLTAPAEGDALTKTATVRWSASDPDKDTLSYDVAYSSDGGKTWTPIKKKTGTTVTKPANAPLSANPTDAEVAAKVQQLQSSLDKHPEIPAAVRQQMLAQAPALIRRAAAQAALSPPAATTASATPVLKETSFAWDTTAVPDGAYQLEVVASDKPSNPTGALTAKSISPTFLVDNTPSTITAGIPTVNADKSVTVTGNASAGPAFVKAVQAKIDGADLLAASATDGLFDGPREGWTLQTAPLTPGTHVLDVQVVDGAGGTADVQVSVSIP